MSDNKKKYITKKQAEERIEQLHKEISRLHLSPNSFIFVDIYQNILTLYAIGECFLAFSIANSIISELKESTLVAENNNMRQSLGNCNEPLIK